jgi:predicted phage terminase large subunit-like protein
MENQPTFKKVKIIYDCQLHENQTKIFKSKARFKIIAKGRRFGFTRGLAKYCIKKIIEHAAFKEGTEEEPYRILWVDTIYSNIERYFERYFRPELKIFKRNVWKYNKNNNEFSLNNCTIDFKSADNPENMEGFGYHLVIVNEAGIVLKKRNLWQESILPMILDHRAYVIIGGTPKGKKIKNNEKHLFYELYQRGEDKDNPKYESFNFSTYDNPLINPKEIKELEKEIPPHLRDQEIRGLFIDTEGSGIIKRGWFKYFELDELATKKRIRKIQIWDTAFKESQENDFSVCETWFEMIDGYYLKHVFRDRLEFPELKKKAIELYEIEKPEQVWIEDKASGISLIQELKRNTRIPLKEIKASKDKVEYVNACAPVIEAGRVKLPFSATWTENFLDECEEFPNGEFDDQIDAMSKFINEIKEKSAMADVKISIAGKTRKRANKYKGYR